jgi:hypothetical protein
VNNIVHNPAEHFRRPVRTRDRSTAFYLSNVRYGCRLVIDRRNLTDTGKQTGTLFRFALRIDESTQGSIIVNIAPAN